MLVEPAALVVLEVKVDVAAFCGDGDKASYAYDICGRNIKVCVSALSINDTLF